MHVIEVDSTTVISISKHIKDYSDLQNLQKYRKVHAICAILSALSISEEELTAALLTNNLKSSHITNVLHSKNICMPVSALEGCAISIYRNFSERDIHFLGMYVGGSLK